MLNENFSQNIEEYTSEIQKVFEKIDLYFYEVYKFNRSYEKNIEIARLKNPTLEFYSWDYYLNFLKCTRPNDIKYGIKLAQFTEKFYNSPEFIQNPKFFLWFFEYMKITNESLEGYQYIGKPLLELKNYDFHIDFAICLIHCKLFKQSYDLLKIYYQNMRSEVENQNKSLKILISELQNYIEKLQVQKNGFKRKPIPVEKEQKYLNSNNELEKMYFLYIKIIN